MCGRFILNFKILLKLEISTDIDRQIKGSVISLLYHWLHTFLELNAEMIIPFRCYYQSTEVFYNYSGAFYFPFNRCYVSDISWWRSIFRLTVNVFNWTISSRRIKIKRITHWVSRFAIWFALFERREKKKLMNWKLSTHTNYWVM